MKYRNFFTFSLTTEISCFLKLLIWSRHNFVSSLSCCYLAVIRYELKMHKLFVSVFDSVFSLPVPAVLWQVCQKSSILCLPVEEPCELGCDGLSYCTNFNNRPTDLFRSCTLQADDAARYDVALWQQQGYLGLPGLQLPVRNISRCSPNMWKAVACALQIKPCHRHTHANRICR